MSTETAMEERRAARIAAARARRANWTPTEEITTTVGDIRPGDFIVRIPQYKNIRGYIIEQLAGDVIPDWETWRESRRGGWRIESRRITLRGIGAIVYPAAAPAVVRRPVTDPAA
jgi:hypothetical protein